MMKFCNLINHIALIYILFCMALQTKAVSHNTPTHGGGEGYKYVTESESHLTYTIH